MRIQKKMCRVKYQEKMLDPIELFGMGYPYYIKKRGNILVLSSDEGVVVLKINEPAPKEVKGV